MAIGASRSGSTESILQTLTSKTIINYVLKTSMERPPLSIIYKGEYNMLPRDRAPTHPGVLLKKLYLDPRKVRIVALGEATSTSRKHLSQIINGHVPISPEMAVRLGEVLGTSAEMWMTAQAVYDLWHARRKVAESAPVRSGLFAVHPDHNAST
jgi:addiction module HigA family antidote